MAKGGKRPGAGMPRKLGKPRTTRVPSCTPARSPRPNTIVSARQRTPICTRAWRLRSRVSPLALASTDVIGTTVGGPHPRCAAMCQRCVTGLRGASPPSSLVTGDYPPSSNASSKGVAGSTGLGRSGVGLIDLAPPGLLRAMEETGDTGIREAHSSGGAAKIPCGHRATKATRIKRSNPISDE
jgi:hypothetical protein